MTKFALTVALIVVLACRASPTPTQVPAPTPTPDFLATVYPAAHATPASVPAFGGTPRTPVPHDWEPEPCLPWLTGSMDAAYYGGINYDDPDKNARELLESLGVQGLDGMELFSWGGGSDMTTGGRSSRYEFKYWLKDEAGEKALGVSVITIEGLCDVKLVDTGLWRRVR